MYDVTARRDCQHPGGEPVNAGKSAPVAAKAAATGAAQARPLAWKTVVKRALAVAFIADPPGGRGAVAAGEAGAVDWVAEPEAKAFGAALPGARPRPG
jgi:hypothetical protein